MNNLYGIPKNEIRKTCILTPFIPKGLLKCLQIDAPTKGQYFSSSNHKDFTLIRTGIGAALAGDAVLGLNGTPCENIILFGSCGLVQKIKSLDIGSLVTPQTAFNLESFTSILFNNSDIIQVNNQSKLNDQFFDIIDADIPDIACATLGSILLEEKLLPFFIENKIDVVEMECSAVFSAAETIQKNYMGLFYVTDILKDKHVFDKRSEEDQQLIQKAIEHSAKYLLQFCRQLAQS